MVFLNSHITNDPRQNNILVPLWSDPKLEGIVKSGVSFWLKTVINWVVKGFIEP